MTAKEVLDHVLTDLSAFTEVFQNPVPVVLFAGRFMETKRLQLLIEAHHARDAHRSGCSRT